MEINLTTSFLYKPYQNEPHIMYPSLELIFLQWPQTLVPVPANYC